MKRISLTPDLSSITELEQSLEEFAAAHELDLGLQNRLNLMLEELITNSVNYSLPSVSGPELELGLSVEDTFVVAQVKITDPRLTRLRRRRKQIPHRSWRTGLLAGLASF